MAGLKLSEDGLYYWDGRQWISTLSPDGRMRWNGYAWVPVAVMAAPVYPYYQQPATVRVATRWTRPMQYTVVAWYAIGGLYSLSTPFWVSGLMTQSINQSFQQQAQLNPNVSPPPPEVVSSMITMTSTFLWLTVLFVVAIAAVVIVGALKRWTWAFYVVLVLLGLSTLYLPFSFAGALVASSSFNPYGFPAWISWLSVGFGVVGAAIFVGMLVAVFRYGVWATTGATSWPVATQPPASY